MHRPLIALISLSVMLAGCQRSPGAVMGAQVLPTGAAARAAMPSLERFVINDVESPREGGSILVRGYLSKTVNATLKFDGAPQSPTYGAFFVATYHFMQANQALPYRLLTPSEAATLLPILKAAHSRAGHQLNAPALVQMIDLLGAYSPAPVPAPVAPSEPAPVAP